MCAVTTNNKIVHVHTAPDSVREVVHREELEPYRSTHTIYHLHLHHRDYVNILVMAENGARLTTHISSSGYLVDLTQPIIRHLNDGNDTTRDSMYTVCNNGDLYTCMHLNTVHIPY